MFKRESTAVFLPCAGAVILIGCRINQVLFNPHLTDVQVLAEYWPYYLLALSTLIPLFIVGWRGKV